MSARLYDIAELRAMAVDAFEDGVFSVEAAGMLVEEPGQVFAIQRLMPEVAIDLARAGLLAFGPDRDKPALLREVGLEVCRDCGRQVAVANGLCEGCDPSQAVAA